ncbi:MAG: triphosphoribosyl-dephospho-CoA synthase [Mobilicoccus sp.]|nr:triphosphoribosyl-dephospho-CoA synthase [Mobilicoccus sp.]
MTPSPLSRTSDSDLDRLAHMVDSALRLEARLTPKPGLVDTRNRGAHGDLDLPTILRGVDALAPWWGLFARCGTAHGQGDPDDLRDALRAVGHDARAAMFEATDGVNTHTGAIFSFGVLLACAGARTAAGVPVDLGICDDVAALSIDLLTDDLRLSSRTPFPGEVDPAVGTAHGEATTGFVTARDVGLVAYREAMQLLATQPHLALGPMLRERALLHALLALLAVNCDLALAHRGGLEAMGLVAARAQQLLALGGALNPHYLPLIESFDDDLTGAGLCPGGTADLLAVTIWLSSLPATTTPAC